MQIVDHSTEILALSLNPAEVLTEKALAQYLIKTGCYRDEIANRMASEVFGALCSEAWGREHPEAAAAA